MKVPFMDLKAQHEALKDEISAAILPVFENTAFAGGPFVAAFEKEFAGFCEAGFCAGVGSGTEALWAALIALGVGPGDEVITVPNTFIATAEAISFCGARPVFIDVDKTTYNMNPDLIEGAITDKTKAIIPVHLFGQMADMQPIMDIARKHGLFVVEDACQAHGAEYRGKRAGSIGDAGCFSFYPGKNLGACGEAGAVVTSNEELDKKIKMFRDHGQSKKYHHGMVGWNGRMDGLQGAILSVKLKHLPQWTEARRTNAALYNQVLKNIDGIILPEEVEDAKHVYHLYAVRMKNRDEIMAKLAEQEIFCGIHYPIPLHKTEAYQDLDCKNGDLRVAECCADEYISLPMFPELQKAQIEKVADVLKEII
jgi:dTDP-4-amino-4,6-dideoxygalactose transaminase